MLDQPLSRRLREVRDAHAVPDAEPAPDSEQPRRLLLGQLLVEKGLLTEADLEAALAEQREDGRPLGQILLAMGLLTQQDLARTLTEQHGFDFSGALRRRLSPFEDTVPESSFQPESSVDPGPPPAEPHGEQYIVREPGTEERLHVAESFLDAADAAFALIDERAPEQLEIVRSRGGELEHLWSYRREDAAA